MGIYSLRRVFFCVSNRKARFFRITNLSRALYLITFDGLRNPEGFFVVWCLFSHSSWNSSCQSVSLNDITTKPLTSEDSRWRNGAIDYKTISPNLRASVQLHRTKKSEGGRGGGGGSWPVPISLVSSRLALVRGGRNHRKFSKAKTDRIKKLFYKMSYTNFKTGCGMKTLNVNHYAIVELLSCDCTQLWTVCHQK